jgi:cyanophycinase
MVDPMVDPMVGVGATGDGLALAFLGSGEFEPWTEPVDRWLLERARVGDGRVLILPTASAHEGDAVFHGWAGKGLEHYVRLGVPAELVPLRTRADAFDPAIVASLDDASVVFFSGGNPARLAAVLDGTPFWGRLVAGLADGLAYAGCSAGVACLVDPTPDSDVDPLDASLWKPGLRLFADLMLMPHWDALDGYVEGLTDLVIGSRRPGVTLVGIDEDTAMVGDGARWTVAGRGVVHLMDDAGRRIHGDGEPFELPLVTGPGWMQAIGRVEEVEQG